MISTALVDYGHFLLRECINQSGVLDFWYGEVRAPSAYVPCLVRRLLPPYNQGREYVQAFRARCREVQGVRHPCLKRPLELGVIEGVPHAVFGLEPGWNLPELLAHLDASGTPLPLQVALSILLPAVHLLASTHARPGTPLVHGALQPGAVWVEASGMVRLSDFEVGAFQEFIVRGLGRHDPARWFVAPERQADWSRPQPGVDVYAIGALMAELLATGRLSEVQRRLPPREKLPLLRRAGRSGAPIQVVSACLDPVPSRRPTMADVHRALKGFLGGASQSATLRAFLADHAPPMLEFAQLAQGEEAVLRALREVPRDKSVFAESTMMVSAEETSGEAAPPQAPGRTSLLPRRLALVGLLLVVGLLIYAFRVPILRMISDAGGAMVMVTVTSEPAGATITFADGRELGTAPLSTPVRLGHDGSVELTAHMPGYYPVTLVRTRRGSDDQLRFDFQLEKKPPGPGAIHVVTTPAGARISVDGKRRGTSPLEVSGLHSSKKHKVSARLKGYRPASREVTVYPGEVTEVTMQLERLPARAAYGSLTVISYPSATLFIDGREMGPTGPDRTYKVAAGSRAIAIANTRTGEEADYTLILRPGAHEVIEYAFGTDSWRIRAQDAQ